MKNKKILIISSALLFLIVVLSIIFSTPYRNSSALVKAIKKEDCEKVEELLSSGIDPNVTTTSNISEFILNIVESTGERPLTVACDVGKLEIVQMLIDYGATAEPYDKCGWSPLNQTLLHYQPDDKAIVELLLKHGADINEDNPFGQPIFHAAEMTPKKYDRKEHNRVYYVAGYDAEVAEGITNIVKMLLQYGDFDVNLKSSYDDSTLLIAATKSGNLYLVKYLLAIGCDATAKDIANKTAYDYAVQFNNKDIIALLES